MKKEFKTELRNLINKQIPCSIQHDGWPCNSCFHEWAGDELGLGGDIAHLLWIGILAIRGDSDCSNKASQIAFLKSNQEFFEDLGIELK